MKPTLACLVTLGCLSAVSSLAQGTIDFRNTGVTFKFAADRLVYADPITRRGLVGTNYAAGLFYLPGGGREMSAGSGIQAGALAFFRQPTTTSPGTWLNPLAVGNNRILDGVPIGATATIQVRVWDITKYQSFAQAFAGGEYGWSLPFDYTVPAAGSAPDAYYLNDLRFPILMVPEPSTIALGILGGVCLLYIRRRR